MTRPEFETLVTASVEAKRLWNKWSRLEVRDGIVCIKAKDAPPKANSLLQLVPRVEVKEVIQ